MENMIEQMKIVSTDSCGKFFGFIATEGFKEKDDVAKSEIAVFRISDSKRIEHIRAEKGESLNLFRLSPDGMRFSYVSIKGDKQYLVIRKIGTAVEERVLLPESTEQVEWAGSNLAVLMKDPEDAKRKEEMEKGNDGFYFEEMPRFSSLFLYKPGFGLERITKDIQVWEFSYLNGNFAIVGSESPEENAWYESKLYLLTGGKEECRMLYNPEPRTLTRPKISHDGKSIAFLESHWSDRGVTSGDIIVYDLERGKTKNITEGVDRSYCDLAWSEENGIYALFNEASKFGIVKIAGKLNEIWSSIGTVEPGFAPEFSFNGNQFFFAFSDAASPPEIYSLDLEGKLKKITDVNKKLNSLKAQPFEILDWKSKDGTTTHGIFRCNNPEDPLIVHVHGGPTSSATVEFIDYSTVYLDHGFSVFLPNYRGSTGYGRKYAEANIGDMGGGDLDDILTGIEFLKNTGRVTTDKLFITGGSYGGYITNLAVTKTDIFSAAVGLFGMSDWLSFHSTTEIAVWDTLYYKGSVYDKNSRHWNFDPLTFADSVKTPLLLMHGVNDQGVPVGQSYEMFRKLKERGKTVRLLLFPREGHGFRERYHRLTMMEESVKWFKKYI